MGREFGQSVCGFAGKYVTHLRYSVETFVYVPGATFVFSPLIYLINVLKGSSKCDLSPCCPVQNFVPHCSCTYVIF